MLDDIRQAIRSGIAELYECEEGPNGSIAVLTPFIFTNGDLLTLYVEKTPGGLVVSDFGETCGWLFRISGIENLTPTRRQKIREIENGTGVQFQRGNLRYECKSSDELAMGIHLVAQAALQVAELRYPMRPPYPETKAPRNATQDKITTGSP